MNNNGEGGNNSVMRSEQEEPITEQQGDYIWNKKKAGKSLMLKEFSIEVISCHCANRRV
jgi:hypothetical protein